MGPRLHRASAQLVCIAAQAPLLWACGGRWRSDYLQAGLRGAGRLVH